MPLSSQWSSDGYYYPTQIAQYGLSHYSKHIADRRRSNTLTPHSSGTPAADRLEESRWTMTDDSWQRMATTAATTGLGRVYDAEMRRFVYHFKTAGKFGPR